MSGDARQEFFSDGMTEEITSALAKVPDLRVVARTSAYQFKAQNRDIQSIGQQLHASHFIEGSVRKAGDRVRITVQLIKADDGTHIWSEDYDRQLTDIFAIQEDIARAITTSLRMPLGLKPGENLVNNRSIDPESYQQYLRAKALVRARGQKPLSDAAALLEQVVARDPNFAPAWAQLGLAYALTPLYDPAWDSGSVDEFRRVVDASLTRAEAAARRAIQLDTNLADGYLSLARALDPRGKYLLAEEFYSKALALDPNNPDALNLYSTLLAGVGRLKEALAMKQRLLSMDPFVPVYNAVSAWALWLNGRDDKRSPLPNLCLPYHADTHFPASWRRKGVIRTPPMPSPRFQMAISFPARRRPRRVSCVRHLRGRHRLSSSFVLFCPPAGSFS